MLSSRRIAGRCIVAGLRGRIASPALFAGSCAVLEQREKAIVAVVLCGGVPEPVKHGVHAAGHPAAVAVPVAGWLDI